MTDNVTAVPLPLAGVSFDMEYAFLLLSYLDGVDHEKIILLKTTQEEKKKFCSRELSNM